MGSRPSAASRKENSNGRDKGQTRHPLSGEATGGIPRRGGASLELLWEGTGSSLVSISGYTLTDYALIYIVFVASGNYYIGACRPDGNTYAESSYRMSVNISGTYANSVSVINPAQARAVYGLKASGGGVAPEPEPEQSEIWYDGNQTRVFTKDGVNIFDYQKIEVVVDTSPIEQATETFTQPFDDFMSSPEGYVMLTIGQSLFFETSATYIRKITAYK